MYHLNYQKWRELFENSIKIALLLLLAAVFSIIEVNFVGDVTIYSVRSNQRREEFHETIIQNRKPEGGWSAIGGNGVNVRILIPYLVENLHSLTGIRVVQIYKAIDLICIFLSIVIIFLFLRKWFTVWECILTCLYFTSVLPVTFAYHTYHPWDRASLVTWLLAIWCARSGWPWVFMMVAAVAVLIKYDAIVLPTLYFLSNSNRWNWPKILAQSCAVGALLAAIFIALVLLIPGGFEPRPYDALIMRNLTNMVQSLIFYAPILVFCLPLMLVIFGYSTSDRFMRANIWFAGLIGLVLFVATNFEEVRAEQMLLPLIAPAALNGLRRILGEPSTAVSRSGILRQGAD